LAQHSIDTLENHKLRGELAELAFMYRASGEGIAVAKPYGESHPYDFLVQHKSRLLRVQVKSTFLPPHGRGRFGFRVVVGWGASHRATHYTIDQIDILAAFIAQLDIWYLIPVEKLGHRRLIFLYPQGRKMPFGGLYEEYREAWHLLKEEKITDPQTREVVDPQVHEFVDR
jgi:hypothetical protein